jgi:hypothetical protein
MKPLYKSILRRTVLCSFVLFFVLISSAQVQTPRHITINGHCNGFYEYLPQGYDGVQQFPLMVFIHGVGELGDGSPAKLPLVLRNGPPKLINAGRFPVSFTVNSRVFKFIVISPQFTAWPSPADVDAVINYAKANYRVDISRVYLTGLSMGGGAVWDYAGATGAPFAQGLAAIVPISGASSPTMPKAKQLVKYRLPIWALHNQNDPTVTSANTIRYVDSINKARNIAIASATPVGPAPQKTIFPASGHDAWTKSYDPAYKENNMNVYEWMLQYDFTRNLGLLPVILTDYKIFVSGEKEVTVNWTTSAEENNQYFSIERSTDGINFSELARVAATNLTKGDHYSYIDQNAAGGNNFYRLSQTDMNGQTTQFEIKNVLVNISAESRLSVFPNPASDYVVLQLNHKETGPLQIKIFSISGRVERIINTSKQSSYWQQQLSIAALPAGYYIVEVSGTQIRTVQRFIKK